MLHHSESSLVHQARHIQIRNSRHLVSLNPYSTRYFLLVSIRGTMSSGRHEHLKVDDNVTSDRLLFAHLEGRASEYMFRTERQARWIQHRSTLISKSQFSPYTSDPLASYYDKSRRTGVQPAFIQNQQPFDEGSHHLCWHCC